MLGINEALTPRYAVLQMGWWVALVVLTAVAAQELARVVWGEGGLASQPPRIATLGAVVVLTVAIFTITAVTVMCGMNNQARSDVDYQNSGYLKKQQVCVLNYATAPDTCLALYQPFSPTLVREEAAELEQLHMGIFY